jgi:hypothetical protein
MAFKEGDLVTVKTVCSNGVPGKIYKLIKKTENSTLKFVKKHTYYVDAIANTIG